MVSYDERTNIFLLSRRRERRLHFTQQQLAGL